MSRITRTHERMCLIFPLFVLHIYMNLHSTFKPGITQPYFTYTYEWYYTYTYTYAQCYMCHTHTHMHNVTYVIQPQNISE